MIFGMILVWLVTVAVIKDKGKYGLIFLGFLFYEMVLMIIAIQVLKSCFYSTELFWIK